MSIVLKNSEGKVLKSQNKWSYFNGATSYIQYADNDVFSFTDGVNDLPFEIEFDINPSVELSTFVVVMKGSAALGGYEYVVRKSNNVLLIRLWGNGSSTEYIGGSVPILINTNYKVKITYDGSKVWTGIKFYFNNILQTVSNLSTGVYIGMVNTTNTFRIGAQTSTSFLWNGYLRNIRIKKNNQLVFFAPLQDSNAVSTDVIGGLVHNAGVLPTVVNKLETERWAYFDGVSSMISIGTTSTLGWMNNNPFRIEFDIKILGFPASGRILYTAVGSTNAGFYFYNISSTIRFYWVNGVAVYITSPILIIGEPYKFILYGDTSNLRFIILKIVDNSLVFDSGNVAYTTIISLTTAFALTFNKYLTYFNTEQIKNFKIYTDTAGNQPFLSLPFQNPDAIAVDTIGGLVGTNTDVRLINNMENVMKNRNLWSYFDGLTSYGSIGTTSTFGWMNDGIFRIEFEIIPLTTLVGDKAIISTYYTSGDKGFKITPSGANNLRFIWGLTNTSLLISNDRIIGKKYRCIIRGDGAKIYYTTYDENGINKTNEPTGEVVAFAPYATTRFPLCLASINSSATGTYNYECYLRNLKIYKSIDTSQPFMFLNLKDNVNIVKDVIGGLQGTVNNVNIIDL